MILLVSGLSGNWLQLYRECGGNVGWLVTPRGGHKPETVLATATPYAMDNDCFIKLNRKKFLAMLEAYRGVAPAPLWINAPDVFGNAAATLEYFEEWEPIIRGMGHPVALTLQDGQDHFPVPWNRVDAVFLGASNAWRFSDAAVGLIAEARRRGKLVHVGRVNSLVRMEWAARIGAHTIDGSGLSKFGKLIGSGSRWLRRAVWLARHQQDLFTGA